MKQFKTSLFILFLLTGMSIGQAQQGAILSVSDLKKLSGSWSGSLTYLDYTSGNPFSLPSELDISRIDKSNRFVLYYQYPDEPKANSRDTLVVSADGKALNKEAIVSKRKLPGGGIEWITESTGKDGNDQKPATFRHTYLLTKNTYSKRKEVKFTGESTWIKRYEYNYQRKKKK